MGLPSAEDASLTSMRDARHARNTWSHRRKVIFLLSAAATLYFFGANSLLHVGLSRSSSSAAHLYAPAILERCRTLDVKPAPSTDFYKRKDSDRFALGTKPTLIGNATIWTGNDDGREIVRGDVLVDRGLIKWIGQDSSVWLKSTELDLVVVDAKGAWLTPGIVDLHSHLADDPSPMLSGASDGNSLKGSAQPWLRSIDGLNTHDEGFKLAVAGGVTTSLILPGSAGAIGGQAFAIKLRPTSERSPTSMLLEPPFGLNGSKVDYNRTPRWRHMKHACGENPSRVYRQTRLDTAWDFRKIYNKAQEIKEAQDAFCKKALAHEWVGPGSFPEELQWEAAVDVLRGKVKVQTHCYEAVDLDNFVRLSNEFKFPIAAFHHAHETYLVPDVLKRAYGDTPPASAMFASFSRYKRESYRHSEFAPKILNDAGLRVVMKSDHPAIVSRYLLHEAQQAHYYGLPHNVAMRSVISTPAEVMGYGHRIGYIREGYDADIVLWDSHPLQLGATPVQVFIDGIAQLTSPHVVEKPDFLQAVPGTPNFDDEAAETIKYEGLPPLAPKNALSDRTVVFTNVSSIWWRDTSGHSIQESSTIGHSIAVVREGRIVCAGSAAACQTQFTDSDSNFVDLRGGSISPGLVSFGSGLGLSEIGMESSTSDGYVFDALSQKIPSIIGGDNTVIHAVDGLQFMTRDALLAYRAGVTSAITAPLHGGLVSGIGVHFSTAAPHRLAPGAVIKEATALHFSVGHYSSQPSISTQIAALRRLLLEEQEGDVGQWIKRILKGDIPLVIDVHSADIIATLLSLKKEVEKASGHALKVTLTGATEAHILAEEIGEADVGVILNPVRPYPYLWETRRILPGPPLSSESALLRLMRHNVTVGFGVQGIEMNAEISAWAARNSRFDVSWAYIEAGGRISKAEAIALTSSNIERLLGVDPKDASQGDLVVTQGGDLLDVESKVVGVISPRRSQVDLF